jgi:hypothetical protein
MTDGINTLDELLNDPMVQLVMARDRVRPEELRRHFERARRRQREPSLPPHMIAESSRPKNMSCA